MKCLEKDTYLRILGIDPGSFACGYGLVQLPSDNNSLVHYLASGRIVMPATAHLHKRLHELYSCLSELLKEFNPSEIVVEKIFYSKGVKSALSLGHCRGVVLLCASLYDRPIYEYSALEVKKAITGYGRADKIQVKKTVMQLLGIKKDLSYDSADALALAYCHANTTRFNKYR